MRNSSVKLGFLRLGDKIEDLENPNVWMCGSLLIPRFSIIEYCSFKNLYWCPINFFISKKKLGLIPFCGFSPL